jgi:hypothetical protein
MDMTARSKQGAISIRHGVVPAMPYDTRTVKLARHINGMLLLLLLGRGFHETGVYACCCRRKVGVLQLPISGTSYKGNVDPGGGKDCCNWRDCQGEQVSHSKRYADVRGYASIP